jgi:hypothetical protein
MREEAWLHSCRQKVAAMNAKQSAKLLICALGLGGCEAEVSEVGAVEKPLPTAETGAGENRAIGEACFPDDEWQPLFTSYALSEVSVEIPSAECASSICLINHFQGRTTCPYGQAAPSGEQQSGEPICALPDGSARVAVAVEPQVVERPPEDTVYCSCRCAGPEGTGPFCACPQGFECTDLVPDLGPSVGPVIEGSYCIKQGTAYDPSTAPALTSCDWRLQNCGPG